MLYSCARTLAYLQPSNRAEMVQTLEGTGMGGTCFVEEEQSVIMYMTMDVSSVGASGF